MLAWPPLAHALHLTISLLWPVLWRIPVLQGTWDGCMDHTIPSYVSTAEEGLFRANLDPVLPMISRAYALHLFYFRQVDLDDLQHVRIIPPSP
jgi:hypothetical protein